MNEYLSPIKNSIKYVIKYWVWPIIRKISILAAIIAGLIYLVGQVNWAPLENWMIDKLTHQEPMGEQFYLPFQGKVSINDTKAYKKEQYLNFKTNLKNTSQLVGLQLGFKRSTSSGSLTSISNEVLKNSKFKDLTLNKLKLEDKRIEDEKTSLSDWTIIKTNLKDSLQALRNMISVRILTENGKPMIVQVNEKKAVVIQYDSTDKLL